GSAPITFRSGTVQVNSILSRGPFSITGGVLQVNQTLEVDNTFTVSGGTLRGARVLPGVGGQGVTVTASATLDGVRLDADVDVSQPYYADLTIQNGLTLNGTLTLGYSDALAFSGSQTLGGGGTVVLGTSSASASVASGSALTVGPNVTIRSRAGNT